MNAAKVPAVSVVVIGRNEGQRLVRCLSSIRRMDIPEGGIETIYVDSDSSDGSREAAERLGARVLRVQSPRPNAAIGRNAGWRAASAPLVFFLDGDTEVHPHFVVDALRYLRDPNVAVVWGHRREGRPGDSVYNRVLDLDWVYPPGWSEFCGGDALVRRSALERVGGFDEALVGGEEPEMCRRLRALGLGILHVDLPMTTHDLAITRWKQYWRRAVRAGHAYAAVSERFRGSGLPLWEDVASANRVHVAVLATLAAGGIAASLVAASPAPLAAAIASFAALVLRSAWRSRWKGGDAATLLLYGLHSHVQQVPILFGQLQRRREAREGRGPELVWYKEAA